MTRPDLCKAAWGNRSLRRARGLALLAVGAALIAPVAIAAQGNVVEAVLSRCGESTYSYETMVQALKQLDQTERVWVGSIGQSREGRAIPLVAIHHPQTVFGQTARLLIIARQHGSEAAGTEAMMALIWYPIFILIIHICLNRYWAAWKRPLLASSAYALWSVMAL